MTQKASAAVSVPFPASATPSALFDKSVGAFKTIFASILKDNVIGKSFTRNADNGIFSYDVIEAYPQLKEEYLATCPNPMDLGTMQRNVLKYVEHIPSSVTSTLNDSKRAMTANNSNASASSASSCDFVDRIIAAGIASPSDLAFRELVMSYALTLMTIGRMSSETGVEQSPQQQAASSNNKRGGVTSPSPVPGATSRVQTRPKAGKIIVEPIETVVVVPSPSAATAPFDPLVTPPPQVMQWFINTFITPCLALLHSDVNLICDNCARFNANNPDKVYVNAAASLKGHASLAVAAVSSQLQTVFAKWWRASAVWKAIGSEAVKINFGGNNNNNSSAQAPAASVPSSQQDASSTAAGEDAAAAALLSSQPTRRSINFSTRAKATTASSADAPATPPLKGSSGGAGEVEVTVTTVASAHAPSPSQQRVSSTIAASIASHRKTGTTPPMTAAAGAPSAAAAAAHLLPPQQAIRDAFGANSQHEGNMTAAPLAARKGPSHHSSSSSLVGTSMASSSSKQIHLTRMTSFEETRKAEKHRLLELLAQRQREQTMGSSSPSSSSSGAAIAATTVTTCPKALSYAIPTDVRVQTVMNHLNAKVNGLKAAERCREEALKAVFLGRGGGSNGNDGGGGGGGGAVSHHDATAAVLFSVFGDATPASTAAKKEEGEEHQKDTTTTATPTASEKDTIPSVFAAAVAASSFSVGTKKQKSALETLTNFYDQIAVAAKKKINNNKNNTDQSSSSAAAAAPPTLSVSDQILSAYSDMQLGELRELLTLIVASLFKATAVTPVLFYSHELAEWYARESEWIAKIAARGASSSASASSPQSQSGGSGSGGIVANAAASSAVCPLLHRLKRERAEEEEEAAAAAGNACCSLLSPPSFWCPSCFPSADDARDALFAASLLSTPILVRMLLWFPHVISACTRSSASASSAAAPTSTSATATTTTAAAAPSNSKKTNAHNCSSSRGGGAANHNHNANDDATNVSLVIASAVACPIVEQLLAFVDDDNGCVA